MFEDELGDRLPFLRWLAWKLVQVAHRLHDPESEESITIRDPDGKIAYQWEIVGSDYGAGISSQWGEVKLPGGWTVEVMPWDDFHKNSVDITDQFRGD